MGRNTKEKHSLRFWVVGFALLLTPIGLLMGWRFSCQSEFDRRIEQLKAEGFPVSLDDLEAEYVLPEGAENAADVYEKAFFCYMPPTAEEIDYIPYCGNYEWPNDVPPFPNEVMMAMASHLEQNQQSLELLDKAAKIEHCLWPRTRNAYYFMKDHHTNIRWSVLLLCERNLYLAQRGQTDALFDSFQVTCAVPTTPTQQSIIIDYLTIMGLKSISAGNLENVLTQLNVLKNPFTATQLRTLQKQFAEMHNVKNFHKTLLFERCCTISFMQLTPNEQKKCIKSSASLYQHILYSASGLEQKDSLALLDIWNKNLAASQLPYHQRIDAFQKIAVESDTGLLAFLRFYLNKFGPSLTMICESDLRITGDLICAETALAVERYRRKYGTLPETLEALVPKFMAELPRDPFDNAPLRYIKRERSFTLYHIGPDGIDDGGLDKDEMIEKTGEQQPKQHDWPFTVGW